MQKIILTSAISLSLFWAFSPVLVSAQSTGNPGGGSTGNPPLGINFKIDNPFGFRGGDSLYGLLLEIVNKIILPIGGVLCVLAFIYAGFLYVTARGDTAQIKTAHNALLYAVIGTAILLGAWVIAEAIRATVNQIIS